VIGAWVLLAIALGSLQPKLQVKAQDESKTFRTRGAESTRVHDLLDSRFPEAHESMATIVFALPRTQNIYTATSKIGNSTGAICDHAQLPWLKAVGTPDGVLCGDFGHDFTPEGGTQSIADDSSSLVVSAINEKDDTQSVLDFVHTLRRYLPGLSGTPLSSYVTGDAGYNADRADAVAGIDGTLLAITGALVLVLMLLIYRSPLIATLMLGVVMIAYLIATGILYGLVEAGIATVSGQSASILIVLMFGAGTDYALLIVARFRDELRRDADVDAALHAAMARSGPAIFASGAIVVLAMLVLSLANYNATRQMGPTLALGIAIMIAAGQTLLPALLAAFGRRAFWPVVPHVSDARSRGASGTRWRSLSAFVGRHPRSLALASIAILGIGALGNLGGRGYLDLTEQYRSPPESVLGERIIEQRYTPGLAAPLDVLVGTGATAQVQTALANQGLVVSADSQSVDGRLFSYDARFPFDPYSTRALAAVPRIRDAVRKAAKGQTAIVGGVTAEEHDNLVAIDADARLIVPLVLALILLILIALLRCVVAPLYLIGTVILSFGFAMGWSSLVFTHLMGQPDSDPNLSIFAFIFLVALGVDDNIFLMTRIREERAAGRTTRDAILGGLESTGGVITSAGLILAGTFASLMALDLISLFQVGFVVTLGLLIDAFLVRTFLVPSIALLLGERNWWPYSSDLSKAFNRRLRRTENAAG